MNQNCKSSERHNHLAINDSAIFEDDLCGEDIDTYIEKKRIEFREEWFRYVEENDD